MGEWFNIGPSSFSNRYSFCGWAGRNTSLWFCFSLRSARKSKYIRFERTYLRTACQNFLARCRRPLVAQVRDQLIQAMRNYDSRVRMVLIYRLNYFFQSICTLQATGCNFQYGSILSVPSNPTFRFRCFFISWQSVLTTSHWICELWEFFSVFCHEVLSDFDCCQEFCISTKFNHMILLWQPFHSFLVSVQ